MVFKDTREKLITCKKLIQLRR